MAAPLSDELLRDFKMFFASQEHKGVTSPCEDCARSQAECDKLRAKLEAAERNETLYKLEYAAGMEATDKMHSDLTTTMRPQQQPEADKKDDVVVEAPQTPVESPPTVAQKRKATEEPAVPNKEARQEALPEAKADPLAKQKPGQKRKVSEEDDDRRIEVLGDSSDDSDTPWPTKKKAASPAKKKKVAPSPKKKAKAPAPPKPPTPPVSKPKTKSAVLSSSDDDEPK